MKFTISTEDFSSRFTVLDSEGLVRYSVKNEMDSVMRKLTIWDLADDIVCVVEKKFFTLRPTYVIYNKRNEPVIHIRKKLNLLHPEFTITSELDEVKFHTIGNFFGDHFSITSKDDDSEIAKITRKGGYTIEIMNPEHDASALIAIALTIHLSNMTLSDQSMQYGREAVQTLLEQQCRIPIRRTTPIAFYYNSSNSLIDEADHFYRMHDEESSFVLYSRYITLFVEELKLHHPGYAAASVNDRERVKEIIRAKAFPRAEELKLKLRLKYAQEHEAKLKVAQEENARMTAAMANALPVSYSHENEQMLRQRITNYTPEPPTHVALFTVPPTDNTALQNNREPVRPTFDRSQKPTLSSAGRTSLTTFRQIVVPGDITPKFLQMAQSNTDRKIETCGILAGRKKDNHYIITHIVVPKQNGGPDSCDTEKEEEMVEYVASNDLITLGWIHTHPTQTAFLSSVDLHTHLPYQMLMQEAVAIVISPKYNDTAIFSLTSNAGIPVISTCNKTGFHEHVNDPPLFLPASHTVYDSALQCKIVDLRN